MNFNPDGGPFLAFFDDMLWASLFFCVIAVCSIFLNINRGVLLVSLGLSILTFLVSLWSGKQRHIRLARQARARLS